MSGKSNCTFTCVRVNGHNRNHFHRYSFNIFLNISLFQQTLKAKDFACTVSISLALAFPLVLSE